MLYAVGLTPDAESPQTALYRYIAQATPLEGALRNQEAIVEYC